MGVKSKLLKSIVILAGTVAVVSIGLICAVFISSTDFSFSKQYLLKKIPKAYVVHSGSMEPTLMVGSLLFSISAENYVQNDIITFRKNDGDNLITHRIYAKTYPEGIDNSPEYTTAGDANEEFDSRKIYNEDIIGKAVFSVPYLGYFANFAKTPKGFILLVIIPATIIIYEEFRSLKREAEKLYRKIKKNSQEVPSKKAEKRGLPKVSLVVPLAGAIIVLASLSAAFLFDKETSRGNIFSAAESFEPAIEGTLVINEVLPNASCTQGQTEAQWIELYNGYPYEINPKNFKITDGTNTIDLVNANNLSIPAGGFLLLAHNHAIWIHCWEDNGVQTGNLGGTLNIDVGHLQLIDTDGTTVIDTVRWGNAGEHDPGQDESIEREPDGKDTAQGTDFNNDDFVLMETPMPGL